MEKRNPGHGWKNMALLTQTWSHRKRGQQNKYKFQCIEEKHKSPRAALELRKDHPVLDVVHIYDHYNKCPTSLNGLQVCITVWEFLLWLPYTHNLHELSCSFVSKQEFDSIIYIMIHSVIMKMLKNITFKSYLPARICLLLENLHLQRLLVFHTRKDPLV